MADDPFQRRFAGDASLLPHMADLANDRVLIALLTEADYRGASFLDQRLLTDRIGREWMAWDALPDLGKTAPRPHHIFHIGHVGSTLISRLVGELPRVLSLREPRILRDLAGAPDNLQRYLPGLRRLMARTFGPDDIAVVKATSFASELAGQLIPADGRALFVHATPQAYLGTSLAGENTMKEVTVLSDSRQQRMAGRVRLNGLPDRPAYHVAAAWACEMTALEQAADALPPGAVEWLDFDRFLADIPGALGDAARFFGIDTTPGQLSAIAAGPLMRRYSKALEYEYSPQLRMDLIAEASAVHAGDIKGALAMLATAAQESPLLARALERSAGER